MNKNNKLQQSKPSDKASTLNIVQQTQYQGPIPRPDDLARYEAIVKGSADRILSMAENEAAHRRSQEKERTIGNLSAQNRQISIAELQTKYTSRSDTIGQALGAAVSFSSIAGSVYLALSGQQWVAAALVGLPLAAVIRALRGNQKTD